MLYPDISSVNKTEIASKSDFLTKFFFVLDLLIEKKKTNQEAFCEASAMQ
jgi:hypothetical protein